MANKYRVKAGHFHDGYGNTYGKGEIVESHLDLANMFPNKFKVIRGPKPLKHQRLLEDQDLAVGVKKPRAATVGTKLESDESKAETGDDDDKSEPSEDEDSDISETEGDEEEADEAPRKKVVKKASAVKKKLKR